MENNPLPTPELHQFWGSACPRMNDTAFCIQIWKKKSTYRPSWFSGHKRANKPFIFLGLMRKKSLFQLNSNQLSVASSRLIFDRVDSGVKHIRYKSWTQNTVYFSLFVHFISFHFISFHFISFHFISFHFISFHFISFHFILFYFISFHFISFYFILFYMTNLVCSFVHFFSSTKWLRPIACRRKTVTKLILCHMYHHLLLQILTLHRKV